MITPLLYLLQAFSIAAPKAGTAIINIVAKVGLLANFLAIATAKAHPVPCTPTNLITSTIC